MRITSAPPAMPAQSAIQPAFRPITSTTITRSWASAVVCSRSIASTAMPTAVSKPNVTSVPRTSLSIVLGTPITTGRPDWCRRCAMRSEPSPPTAMSASRPCVEEAVHEVARSVGREGLRRALHVGRVREGVPAVGRAQDGAARVHDAADAIPIEADEAIGLPVEQAAVPVADPPDLDVPLERGEGRGPDDRVEAGGVPAARVDGDPSDGLLHLEGEHCVPWRPDARRREGPRGPSASRKS